MSTGYGTQARRVFLDSAGLLALSDRNDGYHEAALAIWRRLTEGRWQTVTTTFLVAEAHSLFLGRLGRAQGTAFLRAITGSSTQIIEPTEGDRNQALGLVLRHEDKDYSLTDAISFVVMSRLGVSYAFTFDRHFTQYGLRVLNAGDSAW